MAAIKQIVKRGYSEDVAEKYISRRAIYSGGEDLVSNIVNGTLATLKKGKKKIIDASRQEVFENLQQIVDFTLLEMVNVLREVKPSLSIVEAMWILLMCNLNISQACTVEGDPTPTISKSDSPSSNTEGIEKSISSLGERVQTITLTNVSEERATTGQKRRGKRGYSELVTSSTEKTHAPKVETSISMSPEMPNYSKELILKLVSRRREMEN
ncbi:hypothetical protein Q3G72_028614 [Acer saccharum]|nr:hypothetical protein Q3G72_028614 [Acer saccharum]